MFHLFKVLVPVCFIIFTGFHSEAQPGAPAVDLKTLVNKKSHNYIIIGDWGRKGENLQKETGDAMARTADVLKPRFIVSTGDNFYSNGVQSVEDSGWYQSFESIYTAKSLYTDWYVIAGNHDYHGNLQAQIDYSRISRRWKMPALYYCKDEPIAKSKEYVRWIFVDTSPFVEEYYGKYKINNVIYSDTARQLKWIDSVLTHSKARWNIMVGHHPVYTSGERKNIELSTRAILNPLLQKHKVDLYICGHEHDLQHSKPDTVYTHHFLSGAGAKLRPAGDAPYNRFSKSVNGYMVLNVSSKNLTAAFVNYKNETIYSTEITKP